MLKPFLSPLPVSPLPVSPLPVFPLPRVAHSFMLALVSVFIGSLSWTPTVSAVELNNQAALQGLKEMHVLYDIRKSHPKAMLAYLKGIESNRANLIKEGLKPHQRIIFIADAVKFITTQPAESVLLEHEETLDEIAKQIQRLVELGVKMEVCSAATAYFKVDNSTLLPGIEPVRSGFLSVMGWQAQGYALVPVY